MNIKKEESDDERIVFVVESPPNAPQHPPGSPLASGSAQYPAVGTFDDSRFMSYVEHFNRLHPGLQSTATPSQSSWAYNPQTLAPSQQPVSPPPSPPSQQPAPPVPSPAAQPTFVSAIAVQALQHIVIPRNWIPRYQRVYPVEHLQRTEAERQMDTLYVINNPPPTSHARKIINHMVPQRELLIKPPRGANRAADLVYNVKEKNLRRYGEANVGFIYGQEALTPCTRCAKEGGRYAYCVTIADHDGNPYFFGSCMGCRAQDDTRHCSLANPPPVNYVKRKKTGEAGGGNHGGGSGGSGGSGGVGAGRAGLSTGTFSSAFNPSFQQPGHAMDYEYSGTTPEPSDSSSAGIGGQFSSVHGFSYGRSFEPQAVAPVNKNPVDQQVYWKHVIDPRFGSSSRAASQNTRTHPVTEYSEAPKYGSSLGNGNGNSKDDENIPDEDEPMDPEPGRFGFGGKGWC